MIDRRSTPDPALVRESAPASIVCPLADLRRTPDGARDRQLLLGEKVIILGRSGGHDYVRACKDGYHGFVARQALGPAREATHRISAASSHVYAEADIKSPDLAALSFGSRVMPIGETDDFIETDLGHIPKQHVCTADSVENDPADVALRYLGTPYLWGGNSRWGIDCSGLVQAALLACGVPCPADSDQQQAAFAPATGPGQRGDLLFWNGHVAMLLDDSGLIHANAFHMQTVIESVQSAVERIADPVLAHLRP